LIELTRISRLTLQGFKSFAKKTDMLFGNRFNCILGPNGSGKSNVGDAICFVLGKSSSKSLRAEKSANLIYNGGKTKTPAKLAEVSVFFDNSDKIFPFDIPEVKITRTVRQNGQSIYRINDEKKTRQEIVEMLNLVNINPDGYNIILQGDIIRFVEMSADERRKIIEEVAGISVYEEKKQKAISELDKVEKKLSEADIILVERDTSLKELKKDRNQALRYKKLESQIKINKASYLKIQTDRKQASLNEINEKLAIEQKGFDEVESKISDNKKSVNEKKSQIDAINKELEEKGTHEQNELQNRIRELDIEIATSKQKVENSDSEIKRIDERDKQLSEDMISLNEKTDSAENDKKNIQKSIDEKRKLFGELESRLEKFKQKYGFDQESGLSLEISELEKEAEEKQKEIQVLRESQQEWMREKDKIDVQLEVIDEKIAKVLELEKENKGQIESLKQKKVEFKKATLELSKLLNDDSSNAAQIKNAREKVLHANEELSKLRAKSSSIVEKMAGGEAIKAIIEQKGTIKGIYGTIAELGKVSSKYSLALEIAAGNRISSIVVEDDSVAAKCITFLKQKRCGVATFLPLNKIKERIVNTSVFSAAKSSGAHGLAVDLVSYDSRFKKVFSYVFGGAVVVDSMDTARRIGIGKAKMVTLDGDLAEESGAMKGGFRNKTRSFSFVEKEVAKEIDHYELIASDSAALLSKLENQKQESEEEIIRLREFKANLEGDIIKLEKSMHLDSDDLDVSKKLKKDLSEKTKELDKKIDAMNDDIIECNRFLASNKGKREEIRFKITKLKKPETLAELTAFEDKRQQLKEGIVILDSDFKRIETELKTIFLPEKEKVEKIVSQLKKDKETFENQKNQLLARLKELGAELEESTEKQKKFYKEFGEHYKRRDKLNSEINDLQNNIDSLYEKLRSLEHKSGKINSEKVVLETELTALSREFAEYEGVELDLEKGEERLKREINQFDRMIADLGSINLKAIEIYDAVEKEYNELIEKKEKLSVERGDVIALMNEIDSKKKELFMKTFEVLHENFKAIFGQLNKKGDVQLVLENPEEPLDGGVMIKVRLTGTRFLDIRSLSGGEKTLTALALIFAIQEHEPASFYILDEVDAALDKHNSEHLAKLIAKYCDQAQYIVISHNDALISEADTLYGASMNEHGMTNMVSLKI